MNNPMVVCLVEVVVHQIVVNELQELADDQVDTGGLYGRIKAPQRAHTTQAHGMSAPRYFSNCG